MAELPYPVRERLAFSFVAAGLESGGTKENACVYCMCMGSYLDCVDVCGCMIAWIKCVDISKSTHHDNRLINILHNHYSSPLKMPTEISISSLEF